VSCGWIWKDSIAPLLGREHAERLAELNLGVQDDVLVQYVLQLQNRMGVRVNQEALRTVTGGSDGN
jgi:hypothetical protein